MEGHWILLHHTPEKRQDWIHGEGPDKRWKLGPYVQSELAMRENLSEIYQNIWM